MTEDTILRLVPRVVACLRAERERPGLAIWRRWAQARIRTFYQHY